MSDDLTNKRDVSIPDLDYISQNNVDVESSVVNVINNVNDTGLDKKLRYNDSSINNLFEIRCFT